MTKQMCVNISPGVFLAKAEGFLGPGVKRLIALNIRLECPNQGERDRFKSTVFGPQEGVEVKIGTK